MDILLKYFIGTLQIGENNWNLKFIVSHKYVITINFQIGKFVDPYMRLVATSKSNHELPNFGEHESYSQHFSFNAQEIFVNYT